MSRQGTFSRPAYAEAETTNLRTRTVTLRPMTPTTTSYFKYLHPDRFDVLESQKVRFSPPGALNDPFELLFGTDFLDDPEKSKWIGEDVGTRQFLRHLNKSKTEGRSPKYTEEQFRAAAAERASKMKDKLKAVAIESQKSQISVFRIFCLTSVPPRGPKSLPLWTYYTDGHKGMALEFDAKHPWVGYKCPGTDDPYSGIVRYSEKRVQYSDPLTPDFVFTKAECWRHEGEYRILRHLDTAKDLDCSKVDSLVTFPAKALISVTLGINSPHSLVEKVQAVLQEARYEHIKLNYAEIDRDAFSVLTSRNPPSNEAKETLERIRKRRRSAQS